jgi:hypothetical protein
MGRDAILDNLQSSLRDFIMLHDETQDCVLGKVQPSLQDSIRKPWFSTRTQIFVGPSIARLKVVP